MDAKSTTLTTGNNNWQPQFSRWRHGGWYVDNLRYPSGAVGCVSRNYPDGKWRIVCDPRPFDERPTFKSRVEAALAERELIAELNRNEQPDLTASKPRHLSNFRVEYSAPTQPEHSFEPTCAIVADSALGTVRVFDVPDPDESQRAVAEFACRALNGFEGLVAALQQFISIYPENARRHPDVTFAIRDAEKVLAAVNREVQTSGGSDDGKQRHGSIHGR